MFHGNTKQHVKYVTNDSDHEEYYSLRKDMKDSTTEKEYVQSKRLLGNLIANQGESNCIKLISALKFWHDRKSRCVLAFKTTPYNIPLSRLAESAHASMKSASQNNLSLVDAVHADVTDSARVEARWCNREDGERCFGSGPT